MKVRHILMIVTAIILGSSGSNVCNLMENECRGLGFVGLLLIFGCLITIFLTLMFEYKAHDYDE